MVLMQNVVHKKDFVSPNIILFKKDLRRIWFGSYSKGKKSCSFKHVFVGEISSGSITGFLNYVQLYLQQEKSNVYLSKIRFAARNPKKDDRYNRIAVLTFKWNGGCHGDPKYTKARSTMFLGTKPRT